ncbi:hypothetical protein AXF42_Ash008722 [Apostasia shenzhenica]|uniref:Uncharacterized protein n=1 Tax=Apostasia shenzhenica TaxID=1088818 RepID=A0A2I0B271_9ASPA|nr:hypothetical protein AXF42_Ash008722 [Apostasia shenzhenica]
MSSSLHVSLDDLIKKNKKSPGGYSRGAAEDTAASALLSESPTNPRIALFRSEDRPRDPNSGWKYNMFTDQMVAFIDPTAAARGSATETRTKLYISNLDYGVSNEDIKVDVF